MTLALAFVPAMLHAQSVNDYRLPGATSTPDAKAQGPVDPDAPVVRQAPKPAATPSPTPTITPAPVLTAPAPTGAAQRVRPTTPQPHAQRPIATSTAAATPTPTPSATLSPMTAPSPLPGPTVGIDSTAAPQAVPSPAALPTTGSAGYWPWIAAALALVAATFAALWWWRGRAAREAEIEFEPPVVRPTQPEPTPTAKTPAPAPTPAPAAPRPATTVAGDLDIMLEARRMSASLMATTLNYRLVVTNRGTQPLSALAVEGDMVSAHSSLPPDQQIANDAHRLELRHALVALAPGESAEFTGDFRLPLTEVTPIRAGQAAYFVPLARLRVEASTPAGGPLVSVQTFVVGELPENPGAALRPFRLDLGPRTYSRIGQRAVS